ncbi:Maf family protein [Plasticicumulans acidivorans]|uniref:7-methyl-GTP pyrophosphatase n=1 Tax=Plasticicumulans acidivorans TaxID=886464 RepID=A0A317MSC9_9GAMM|nr:Maf family nucleotide pyrophosphatase [Plasticicumulans acidivorans]PWV59534.1 MAF protein [Plasticicumulans acidivorans]
MIPSLSDGRRLVLASTSPYRRQLLERLALPFECARPGVDETPLPGEAPRELVARLALAKASVVAQRMPHALVIGSDQIAVLDDAVIGKPGTHAAAREQLQRASGRSVEFLTSLCLFDADSGNTQLEVVSLRVHFRALLPQQIERYLQREQPYDCAGSFKSEGLGIALFERLEGDDPNALIGLPLIALTTMLEAEGVSVL